MISHILSETKVNKYRLQKFTLMQITKYFQCLICHISIQKEFSISYYAFISGISIFPQFHHIIIFPICCQCQLLHWTTVFRCIVFREMHEYIRIGILSGKIYKLSYSNKYVTFIH